MAKKNTRENVADRIRLFKTSWRKSQENRLLIVFSNSATNVSQQKTEGYVYVWEV